MGRHNRQVHAKFVQRNLFSNAAVHRRAVREVSSSRPKALRQGAENVEFKAFVLFGGLWRRWNRHVWLMVAGRRRFPSTRVLALSLRHSIRSLWWDGAWWWEGLRVGFRRNERIPWPNYQLFRTLQSWGVPPRWVRGVSYRKKINFVLLVCGHGKSIL